MLGRGYERQDCSAARALELVGERWSLLIIRDAVFRGYTQFNQFQESLGCASNVLAARLARFVETGLMVMDEGPSKRSSYHLTPKGLELKAVVMALTQWGDAWVRAGPVEFVDGDGRSVALQPTASGRPVDLGSVRVRRRLG